MKGTRILLIVFIIFQFDYWVRLISDLNRISPADYWIVCFLWIIANILNSKLDK